MSSKFILNDNEVVFNEDVEQNDDWRGRDLYRWLEAVLNGFHNSASSGAGVVDGGAVIAGMESGVSATNLDFTLFAGTALFGFGGLDPTITNGYQIAQLEENTVVSLPAASATQYRWDLVEISASQVTSTETRDVLTPIGPTRGLVPTNVPKLQVNSVQVRVRSGPLNSIREDALLPDLAPDRAWIPVHAILVEPGSLIASGLTRVDLRKRLSRSQPEDFSVNGFDYPPNIYSEGIPIKTLRGPRNWVTLGGYRGPMLPPIDSNQFQKLDIDPNRDRAAGLTTFNGGQFYYVYAYRPSPASGYISAFISDIPPVSVSSGTVGSPSASLTMPTPFPGFLAPRYAHYLGAVQIYQVGADFRIRPMRQHSGLVSPSSFNVTGGFSGLSNSTPLVLNTFTSGSLTTGISTHDFVGLIGERIAPPHIRTIKAVFNFTNTGGVDCDIDILTIDDFLLWEGRVLSGHTVSCTLDVPVQPGTNHEFKISVQTAGATVDAIVNAVGYYEESA